MNDYERNIEDTSATVTLYSKSNCAKCAQTKRLFEKYGIAYQEVNLEAHPELVEKFKTQGFFEAPIVDTPHKTWSGFRPDDIKTTARMADAGRVQTPSLSHLSQEAKSASAKLHEEGHEESRGKQHENRSSI